jgi:hypothetical protein
MKKIVLFIGVVMFATYCYAQKSEVFVSKGYAINGYDAVAYFNAAKSVEGKKTFLYQWHDANWFFQQSKILIHFRGIQKNMRPVRRLLCLRSFGRAQSTYRTRAWTIVDGKLYLNYNKDVQQLWKKDIPGRIKKAEDNWSKVKDTQ